LPEHTPLIATLKPGVLVLKKADGSQDVVFIAGGFLEVLRNKIVVLADTAERAENINEAKVEEARAARRKRYERSPPRRRARIRPHRRLA